MLEKPQWTQPSLSAEEIRRNGGIPPPPQPIFPTEFTIQLYNPEQQVIIRQQTSKWTGTVTFEFCMPQTSFRTPSASDLDRRQNDPVADTVTPMINFVWRKEGRIGKDMTCYLTGKSTDRTGKKAKKNKEPDIAVAMFSGLKEMTIMEPHLYRVEMEDYKGLEVVLLLSAAVIRDIFFHNPNESFHIGDARKNSLGLKGRKTSSPTVVSNVTPPVVTNQPLRQSPTPVQGAFPPPKQAALAGLYAQPLRNDVKRQTLPPLQTSPPSHPQPQPQPGPQLDPRAQWEIDAETARLKAQVEAERRKQEAAAAKARRRAEEEEARKTRQFLENEERQRKQEEKERRRRQAEVDKETERLRRQFGDQRKLFPTAGAPARPQQPQRYSAPLLQQPFPTAQRPPVQPPRHTQPGPYLQVPHQGGYAQGPGPTASQASFFSSSSSSRPVQPARQPKMRKSFFGLRSVSEQGTNTLRKKQSNLF